MQEAFMTRDYVGGPKHWQWYLGGTHYNRNFKISRLWDKTD